MHTRSSAAKLERNDSLLISATSILIVSHYIMCAFIVSTHTRIKCDGDRLNASHYSRRKLADGGEPLLAHVEDERLVLRRRRLCNHAIRRQPRIKILLPRLSAGALTAPARMIDLGRWGRTPSVASGRRAGTTYLSHS